ncbi:uncharacterized protein LOC133704824 isoform X3 [Populus nigra]|uniref:uncharacterized protein LOC133704824 isoform X3 n=1 Tax=Populus nigra TaxID=3691 RepID=UPI002B2712AD|nr:uncharacterized protein LOC133704824 isoform X3 [Populus nigra]
MNTPGLVCIQTKLQKEFFSARLWLAFCSADTLSKLMFNSRFITELLKSPTVKLYSKDLQRLYVPAEVFVLLSRLHEGKVFWPAYHIDMLHSLLTCSPVVPLSINQESFELFPVEKHDATNSCSSSESKFMILVNTVFDTAAYKQALALDFLVFFSL